MKTIIISILIILTNLLSTDIKAQKIKKTETVVVKTSTQCGMCKQRLEKAMAYEKGIVSSKLDVEKAEFTIIYKPTKTNPEKIRLAISETGYDADKISANPKAYEKLPDCCKKGGMGH
jgi:copper chaperone CopZ